MREITIDNITIKLSSPDELDMRWVGQQELLYQLLAAWMVVDPSESQTSVPAKATCMTCLAKSHAGWRIRWYAAVMLSPAV